MLTEHGLMKELLREFGAQVKNIRNNTTVAGKRCSLSQMAEYLDTSVTYLCLVENGKRMPSLRFVLELCTLADVDLTDLLRPVYDKYSEWRKRTLHEEGRYIHEYTH